MARGGAALAALLFALTIAPRPGHAQPLACGGTIDAGQTVTLAADLDCTGASGHGVVMRGGTLGPTRSAEGARRRLRGLSSVAVRTR